MARTIEVSGDSVDAAIEKGLAELGLTRDKVYVDVIDEGSNGIFGFASREALVKISVAEGYKSEPEPVVEEVVETEESVDVVEVKEETAVSPPPPAPAKAKAPKAKKPPVKTSTYEAPVITDEELEQEREMAVKYVSEIIERMGVDAAVSGLVNEADDVTGHRVVEISVTGDDVRSLVGGRGETLDSLQYLTRIMVGNDIRRRSNFMLDIGGFRSKRTQALQRLAERMADKAVESGKRVKLEPMSSYERRIIHMALRDDGRVRTESAGEGRDRRVVVVP